MRFSPSDPAVFPAGAHAGTCSHSPLIEEPRSNVLGPNGVEAIRMAIADFGGKALGKEITVLTADHQNKPDIGASKVREWIDTNGMTMLLGGTNTAVSIATSKISRERKVPMLAIGAGGSSLTNADCSPYLVHYAHTTTALANGTARTIAGEGNSNSWFFMTADYAFGHQLQESATNVIKETGGKAVGSVRVPLNTSDFSSFLLQAQGSGAKVLGLANAGTDFSNSLKAANEFQITKTMKPVALLAFISDIHSLGLKSAQGLYLTDSWYWDTDDETRAFAKRFQEKTKRMPTSLQAAYYSATLTYLKAVQKVGSTDGEKVMAELRSAKIDDMYTKGGHVREDGLMVHPMYVMQVKKPEESKGAWDYYKQVRKLDGDEAWGPLSKSTCPLVKKS